MGREIPATLGPDAVAIPTIDYAPYLDKHIVKLLQKDGNKRIAVAGFRVVFITTNKAYASNVGPLSQKNWKTINQVAAAVKAVVIVPQITIDFAEMESSGTRKLLNPTARVGAKPRICIEPRHTQLMAYWSHPKMPRLGDLGGANITKKPVVLGTGYAVAVKLDEKNNRELISALGALGATGGNVSRMEEDAFVANPDSYENLSLAAVFAANEAYSKLIADSL